MRERTGIQKVCAELDETVQIRSSLADIEAILAKDVFNKNYGKRRMYEKLQLDYDCAYSYNTVAKVMQTHGLLHKKNKPKGLTKADKLAQKSDNLLSRDFSAAAPGEKVVTDITEWTACDGKLYLSGLFDCYDNMCLGIALADNMRTELCIETYQKATANYNLRGAISHSDRCSQYISETFRQTLVSMGMQQSMNSAAGRCHDNAKCESMWARGKQEIMACYDVKRMTCQQLKQLLIYYYDIYWNYYRICSAIGGMPPSVKRGAFLEMLTDKIA